MSGNVRGWARDTEATAPAVEEADPGFFEHRAMLAFRLLAAIYVAGIVLALFPEPNAVSLLQIIAFNTAALILAIVYLVVARGLRWLRPWAVATARPLLVLVIVEDVAGFLLTFAEGRVRGLPVGAAIATWALLGPAGVRPIPRPQLRSTLSVAVALPMLATLVFATQVFGWGGALDVKASDLAAAATASCGPAGGNPGTNPGEPPSQIHITYDFSWQKGIPVASGFDVVVVGWTGDDAQGRPLYLIGRSLPTQPGIYDGKRSYPSLEMGNAVAAASEGSWQWGIVLDEQKHQPGRIELNLDRAHDPAPGSQPLRIVVSYVHLGLWHVDTALTCEW